MTQQHVDLMLLLGALVVLVAIATVRISSRFGLPSLLAYLGLGLALGESGLGIQFENFQLASTLGLIALMLILAEGGLTTSWRNVRPVIPYAVVLATVGVTISIAVTAVAAYLVVGDFRLALLMGAVLAPTDAAAVFSVLRRLPLPPRISGALEAESGFNDAPVVLIVILLSSADGHSANPLVVVGTVVLELLIGAAVGAAVGPLGAYTLRRVALPASGLYPVAVLSFAVGAYAAATLLHGSGFLAVYLAALILGTARLPHRPATRGFAEGVAWLAQIGLFVMLGLLASPNELPGQVLPGLVVGLALLLLARPLSVVVCSLPFRIPLREQAFFAWAGLRGAVPIVLMAIPLSARVPGAERVFAMVFVIVVVLTLIQGPTLPRAARRLSVAAPAAALQLDVEAAPLEELHADLLQVRIPPASRLDGVEVFELRLPPQANITLIVRDGEAFVPGPSTRLQRGDELLVVAAGEVRRAVERRLRAVDRAGKLARWLGESGT